MRTRAQNVTGEQLVGHLEVLEAALAKGADSSVPGLDAFVVEGRSHRSLLARLVHGELSRKQFDKEPLLDWIKQAKTMRTSVTDTAPGPAWEPPGLDTVDASALAATGGRATGVFVSVERSGWGNEFVASLEVSIQADIDGVRRMLHRKIQIDVTRAPRVGDRVEVAYDPDDPNRFVYRALIDQPQADAGRVDGDDRISKLRELADLHRDGVLTDDEFQREKDRLLDG
jgi:hypothetical protein